jgi:hypothetical protein
MRSVHDPTKPSALEILDGWPRRVHSPIWLTFPVTTPATYAPIIVVKNSGITT